CLVALTLGCTQPGPAADGGTESGDDDGTTGDGDPPDIDPSSACEGRLEPLAPTGEVQTVGDGTAASCTEQALHAAVAAIHAAEGGGTVLFDCGGQHTITLTESLFVSNTVILHGNRDLTLRGGGAVQVHEVDHHIAFVLQRLTIRDGHVPAGADNQSGAGLLHPWFGTLKVIDVVFENNHSASVDHDVGGGAIYE